MKIFLVGDIMGAEIRWPRLGGGGWGWQMSTKVNTQSKYLNMKCCELYNIVPESGFQNSLHAAKMEKIKMTSRCDNY